MKIVAPSSEDLVSKAIQKIIHSLCVCQGKKVPLFVLLCLSVLNFFHQTTRNIQMCQKNEDNTWKLKKEVIRMTPPIAFRPELNFFQWPWHLQLLQGSVCSRNNYIQATLVLMQKCVPFVKRVFPFVCSNVLHKIDNRNEICLQLQLGTSSPSNILASFFSVFVFFRKW